MKIPDKIYNIIKYALCIAIPAVIVALKALQAIYGWEWVPAVCDTIVVAQTLLAALFSISLAGYNKTEETTK